MEEKGVGKGMRVREAVADGDAVETRVGCRLTWSDKTRASRGGCFPTTIDRCPAVGHGRRSCGRDAIAGEARDAMRCDAVSGPDRR